MRRSQAERDIVQQAPRGLPPFVSASPFPHLSLTTPGAKTGQSQWQRVNLCDHLALGRRQGATRSTAPERRQRLSTDPQTEGERDIGITGIALPHRTSVRQLLKAIQVHESQTRRAEARG